MDRIYLLKCSDKYKIGYSSKPASFRITTLQTGNPDKISLVCEKVVDNAAQLEKDLHTKYEDKRCVGEWFALHDEDVEYIKSIEDNTYADRSEPEYIKVYTGSIDILHKLQPSAKDLLAELLQYVSYGTQEIVLNSAIKKKIAKNTDMAVKTLDNKLQALARAGILDRVALGTYMLNPFLFGKGDWKTIQSLRNQNIHLKIEYDAETGERYVRGNINDESAEK